MSIKRRTPIEPNYPVRPRKSAKTNPEIFLGKDSSNQTNFFLNHKFRQYHTHIIGSTGKGKSKLLELLIRNDIENKNTGICVIDPTGRLYKDILQYVSLHAPYTADRFVLLDFSKEDQFFAGFNPIPVYKNPDLHFEHLDYNCQMIVSAIQKAWGQTDSNETPRMDRWLPNILSLAILNNLTLLETVYIANTTNGPFRKRLLENIGKRIDPSNYVVLEPLISDWKEFETLNPRDKATYMESSFNRLRRFVSDKTICSVIGQQAHIIDIKKIMSESKVLLVNLQGGTKVHSKYTNLMGILLIHEIVRVARQNRNDDDPNLNPFYLYIDEFGQLITQEVADALDLVRKRKLYFTLAHQTLAQIQDEKVPRLMSSVGTNCRVKIAFGGLNFDDAQYMADELFGAHYDFDTPKHTLMGDEYEPVLRKETVHSWGKSTSENKGGSSTTQKTSSSDRGISEPDDSGFFSQGERVRRKGESSSNSESTSSSWGTNTSEQSGESETFVTDHIKHRVVKSITWYSPEELKIRKAGLLKNLEDRHAIIKLDSRVPVEVEIAEVKSVRIGRFTADLIPEFKIKSFENNQDFYLPASDAFKEISDRREMIAKTFGRESVDPFPGFEESKKTDKETENPENETTSRKTTNKKRKSQFR